MSKLSEIQRPVVFSLTSLLIGFLRDEIKIGELLNPDLRFWFNCCRSHLFDEIPMEASWVNNDYENHIHGTSGIPEDILTIEQLLKINTLRNIIYEAERKGLVSWRDQRQSLK